jgi:Zn-dependent protease
MGITGNKIPILEIFGIKVYLDYSWFIIFLLITITIIGWYREYPPHFMLLDLIFAMLSAIFLFISVMLHELGHSLVAKKFGIDVKEIDLFIFGGVAIMEDESPSPKAEFLVAIAGPIVSLVLGIFFFILFTIFPKNNDFSAFLKYLTSVNFMLFAFNLVPAFPLDGGRILRAIIWKLKDILIATKIVSITGKVFSIILMILGAFYFISGNFLIGLWYIFIGIFLYKAAKYSYESTKLNTLLSRYKVEDVMDLVEPLFPNQTIAEYMSVIYPVYKTSIYPVIGNDGKFYYISLEDIQKVPFKDWPVVPVIEIAKPIEVYISPYDKLTKALMLMNRYGLDELPVIYKNTLLGMLKRHKIEYIIQEDYKKL